MSDITQALLMTGIFVGIPSLILIFAGMSPPGWIIGLIALTSFGFFHGYLKIETTKEERRKKGNRIKAVEEAFKNRESSTTPAAGFVDWILSSRMITKDKLKTLSKEARYNTQKYDTLGKYIDFYMSTPSTCGDWVEAGTRFIKKHGNEIIRELEDKETS